MAVKGQVSPSLKETSELIVDFYLKGLRIGKLSPIVLAESEREPLDRDLFREAVRRFSEEPSERERWLEKLDQQAEEDGLCPRPGCGMPLNPEGHCRGCDPK